MSSVLPAAEAMLSEQRMLRPFASTLSASHQITQQAGVEQGSTASDGELVTRLRQTVGESARRGELIATAIVYSAPCTLAGAQVLGVFIELDHRDRYSIVVTFPYGFSDTGQLTIEEPFANEGEHRMFEDESSAASDGGGE